MMAQKNFVISVFMCILHLANTNYAFTLKVEYQCIPVKLCPETLNLLLTRHHEPKVVEFLRHMSCGFDGTNPKVWCKISSKPRALEGNCVETNYDPLSELLEMAIIRSNSVDQLYHNEFDCNTFDATNKLCWRKDNQMKNHHHHHHHIDRKVKNVLPKECGKQNNDNRINGNITNLDEYPWMVRIKYVNKNTINYRCTGTLISSRYVITAAHCVDPIYNKKIGGGKLFSVILGEYDSRNVTDCIYSKYGKDCADPVQEIEFKSIHIHPDFTNTSKTNDIALIRLRRKAIFSDYVKPICLPSKMMRMQGNETFQLSGWGENLSGKTNPVKQKTTVQFGDTDKCAEIEKGSLHDGQICVGRGQKIEQCFGDSGGPLMLDMKIDCDFASFQVGLISYTYNKGCGPLPTVYTYIPYYIDWIMDTMY